MSTQQTDRRQLLASRFLIIAGVLVLVFYAVIASLYFGTNTRIDICNSVEVEGVMADESPLSIPTTSPSLFPPGVACSFFAGEGRERVVVVNDAGMTEPIVGGIILVCAGSVLKVFTEIRRKKAGRP